MTWETKGVTARLREAHLDEAPLGDAEGERPAATVDPASAVEQVGALCPDRVESTTTQ